jgi:diaminopimelate epimerase
MDILKAHAYGNDFLLVPAAAVGGRDLPQLARMLCDRHAGVGADGLIVHALTGTTATMQLFNADGSTSELSGNGLRCLAAVMARSRSLRPGQEVAVETGAGLKRLELLHVADGRYTFRAAMGAPEDLRQASIDVEGETVAASVLRIGNPQCVVLGRLPDEARFRRLGQALASHSMFPAGTNVEFAQVDAPGLVRILIWERGVGPTSSSGTGTAAAAVAAAAHGGAARDIDVVAPGGTQHVAWRNDGVYLTGWADIILDGRWLGA